MGWYQTFLLSSLLALTLGRSLVRNREAIITENFDNGFGVFENYRPNITGAYWTYRYDLDGERGLVNPRPSGSSVQDPVAHFHTKGQITTGSQMVLVARRYDEGSGTTLKAQLYDAWNDQHLEAGEFSTSSSNAWYSSLASIFSAGGESRKICIQGRGATDQLTSYVSDILLYIEGDVTGPTGETTTSGPVATTIATTAPPIDGTTVTSSVTTVTSGQTTGTRPTVSPSTCTLTVDGTSQLYYSPNFPDNFPAGSKCTETITFTGAAKVKATFNLFHVPSPLDPGCTVAYLSLKAGTYTERFCGYADGFVRTFNSSTIEANFVGTANEADISDSQFKITFTAA